MRESPGKQATIRPFTQDDAGPVSAMREGCVRGRDIGGHTERGTRLQIAGNSAAELVRKSQTVRCFAGCRNGTVIGICGFDKRNIHAFFVDSNRQGEGIVRMLLDHVIADARRAGVRSAGAWSTECARSFYVKKVVASSREYIRDKKRQKRVDDPAGRDIIKHHLNIMFSEPVSAAIE